MSAKNGNLKFALQRVQNRTLPVGTLTAQLADVDAGLALRRIDASAKLARESPDSMAFDVTALDQRDRRHGFNGTLDFGRDPTVLRLTQASLSAPDGAWKLTGPATVSWRDKVFLIEQLALKNGAREARAQRPFRSLRQTGSQFKH